MTIMKGYCMAFFLAICLNYIEAFPETPVGDPITAIKGVVTRILGDKYVDSFEYQVIPQDNGQDVFEISNSSDGSKPLLKGNNGVSLASALNAYLKYYCNCSISWGHNRTGDQLKLPTQLPLPSPKEINRVTAPVKYRYYQNVCTVSYSMAWWDYDRWERELDWMAMNGINLPLSFTGQEYVWQKLYKSLGLTDDEIKAYFSGGAFLAWQRMGNIRGWGGPLDDGWIANQADIQKKILARARELGIINVLPGFSGHVPAGIKRLYPNAKLLRSAGWGNFNSTYTEDYLLEPTDPLFPTLATKFYKVLIDEFGTDHVFNADTYNEMNPSSTDETFLANTNKAIYDAMAAVDPEAVFLMQGWLFHSGFWTNDRIKAFLSQVPNDKMIILDLNSEQGPVWSRTSSFFGKPFVWCMLHNYGGTRGIYGDLKTIATGPITAKQTPGNTMIGTGMTPEAIEHNPVMYDLMGEMGWLNTSVNVDQWLQYYASRRYGSYNPLTEQAWAILNTSAYSRGWSWSIKSIVDRGPGFKMGVDTNFNVSGLVKAWTLLYESANNGVDSSVGPYQYDLVDIGRQCLVDLFYDMYRMYTLAYDKYTNSGIDSSKEMISIRTEMVQLLTSLDEYLATNVNFLLGTWISDARMSAPANSSSDVVKNCEFNARNQITMWGYHQNIEDYASKEWAGLVKDYYLQRWILFFKYAEDSVTSKKPFDNNGYQNDRFNVENGFSNTIKSYPTEPVGDVMGMTKTLLQKYTTSALSMYTTKSNMDISNSNLFGPNSGPWTRHLGEVAYLCSINPTCVGFNSNGWMKNDTATMIQSQGTILYLKPSSH